MFCHPATRSQSARLLLRRSLPGSRASPAASACVPWLTAPPPSLQACRCASVKRSPSRSPTAYKSEKRARAPAGPSGGGDGGGRTAREAAQLRKIFPADPQTLLEPLELAIDVLDSEFTAQQCVDVIAQCRRVYEDGAVAESVLLKNYGITPYQIHSVALLLLYAGAALSDGAAVHGLASLLLQQAGAAPRATPGGYLPSTLTVLNMLGGPQGGGGTSSRVRESSFFRDAEKRFLAYLADHKTPLAADAPGVTTADRILQADAFTQAGVLAEISGDAPRALRWFRAAVAVGRGIPTGRSQSTDAEDEDIRPREPKWDWERRCLEAIGRLQAREGGATQKGTPAYETARAAVRTAALALRSGEACLLLATDYADDADEPADTDLLLYRAAAAPVPGANAILAARMAARAREASGADAKWQQMWAEEWQAIAAATEATEKP